MSFVLQFLSYFFYTFPMPSIKHQSIVFSHVFKGLGYSDVENRTPCTSDTVFRIASISKPITMGMLAKLWENGDLDLDKPVQHYLPQFPVKYFEGQKVMIYYMLLC